MAERNSGDCVTAIAAICHCHTYLQCSQLPCRSCPYAQSHIFLWKFYKTEVWSPIIYKSSFEVAYPILIPAVNEWVAYRCFVGEGWSHKARFAYLIRLQTPLFCLESGIPQTRWAWGERRAEALARESPKAHQPCCQHGCTVKLVARFACNMKVRWSHHNKCIAILL